ncbi:MAG: glycosyltransferase, partial [bacterium]
MSEGDIELSLIVLSWNTLDITVACIESILIFHPDCPWELIIIDNASSDESPSVLSEKYSEVPEIRLVLNEKNLGFTGGNNQGIEMARGRIIGLLNSDTVVSDGALSGMYSFISGRGDIGVAGPILTHDDGTPTTSFGYFPTPASIFTTAFLPGWMWGKQRKALGVVPDETMIEPFEVDYVSGAAFFIRREVIKKV